MENLSKALIMISAVLLVILIIGLMMIVLNTAKSPIQQVADNMTEEERTLFNNRFTSFRGQAVSGVEAKELINIAMQNTVEQIDLGSIYKIPEIEIEIINIRADGKENITTENLTIDDFKKMQSGSLDITAEYTKILNQIYIYRSYEINTDLSSEDGIVSKIHIKPVTI